MEALRISELLWTHEREYFRLLIIQLYHLCVARISWYIASESPTLCDAINLPEYVLHIFGKYIVLEYNL